MRSVIRPLSFPLDQVRKDFTMKLISFIAASAAAFCMGGVADLPLGSSEARAAELISVNNAGTDSGNGLSIKAVASADGTKVAFYSQASDFGPKFEGQFTYLTANLDHRVKLGDEGIPLIF